MEFEDNFVEALPGFLVDPVLKLHLQSGSTSGLEPDQAYLVIAYDPQARADRLIVPPSEEQRAWRLMSPIMAPTVNDPILYRSDDYKEISRIFFTWDDHDTFVRYKIGEDAYGFKLLAKIISNSNYPVVSERPLDTILYCMASAAKLRVVRTHEFPSERHPNVRRLDVCLKTDVARASFGLRADDYAEAEPGWLLLSSQELAR